MKITGIKYTEEFKYHGLSEWIGLSAEIIEGEDVKKCLYELQKKTREFFFESFKSDEKKQMGTHIVDVPDNYEVDVEFENVVHELKRFEFMEDAQEYLNTTSFRLTLAAKNIVNSKPSKNEKK